MCSRVPQREPERLECEHANINGYLGAEPGSIVRMGERLPKPHRVAQVIRHSERKRKVGSECVEARPPQLPRRNRRTGASSITSWFHTRGAIDRMQGLRVRRAAPVVESTTVGPVAFGGGRVIGTGVATGSSCDHEIRPADLRFAGTRCADPPVRLLADPPSAAVGVPEGQPGRHESSAPRGSP